MTDKKTTSKKSPGKRFSIEDSTIFDYAKYKGYEVKNGRIEGLSKQEFGKLTRRFNVWRASRYFRNGFFQLEKLITKGGMNKGAYEKNKERWGASAKKKADDLINSVLDRGSKK